MKTLTSIETRTDNVDTEGTVDVQLGDRVVRATWCGTDDLEIGKSLMIWGPSAGAWFVNENSASVVTSITIVSDRTNTTVTTSNGAEFFGNWSRMRWLIVDADDAMLG